MAPKAQAAVAAPQDQAAAAPKAGSNPVGVLKRSNSYYVDPRLIGRREGWNPRFDFGEIEALSISIQANGMLNPIRVKRLAKPDAQGRVFELIDGDRRLTACEAILKKNPAAFPEGIPAHIVDKGQDDLTSLIQMFEANSGKVFLPLEEAAAYQRMRDAGMTIADICKAVGRKQVHVTEIFNLLKADDSVKEAVQTGAIGKTMAKKIATVAKGDKAAQKELLAKAAAAKKGDKGAKADLKSSVDKAHRATAAKRGKTLKIRALSDNELSVIGKQMADHLVKLLEEADLSVETDLVAMIRKDPKMVIAYTTGALDALKVAAGGQNDLVL